MSLRSGSSTSTTKPTKKPRSIFSKILEARKRIPWGGERRSKNSNAKSDASFESLRKDDKVSVKEPLGSATSARPYGLGKDAEVLAMQDSPSPASDLTADTQSNGELSDHTVTEAEAEQVPLQEADATSQETHPVGASAKISHGRSGKISRRVRTADTSGKVDRRPTRRKRQAQNTQRSRPQSPALVRKCPSGSKLVGSSVSQLSAERTLQQNGGTELPQGNSLGQSLASGTSAGKMSIAQAMGASPAQTPTVNVPAAPFSSKTSIMSISPMELKIMPLDISQPPVPYLEYGLDRVLFNPGVYQLQDATSRVYNFDPYLQKIMPVLEFDFDALKQYKTSSQDEALARLASEEGKRYIGSTSSMTGTLCHMHFLLSAMRPLNLDILSKGFGGRGVTSTFTKIMRAPNSIFLRWKNGSYAIDADKQFDTPNVLMLLGKSMELLLTLPREEYERYRKSDPREVPDEQRTAPEAYQYTTMGDFLMRSQLDAHDPRLPGNGTFDLKTRAVVSVRMSTNDYEPMTGYELYTLQGKYGSYEREYYDMMRATMLKYMLQARMGRMNGIFVAYHNVKRIFGFQYVPMHEMDRALHGQPDTCLGDQEFKASLEILNKLLDRATAKFPERSLRLHFETQQTSGDNPITSLHCFAEPMAEDDIDAIQNSQKSRIAAFENEVMGVANATAGEESDASTSSVVSTTNATDDMRSIMDFSTSDSNADTAFLESIERAGQHLKPLFYATVIVQNHVNGQLPPGGRPEALKASDKWTIDYLLKEFEITTQEWAMYEDVRARRKHIFWDEGDEDGGDGEGEGRVKKEDGYISFLKSLADQGRQFRAKVDETHAGKEPVLLNDGLPPFRENIDDLDDYMSWLYHK